MIYNYINSIYSKKVIFVSIIFIFYTIYSINSSNLSIKGIVGIILSLFLAWYIIDKYKSTEAKHNILINHIVNEIPILKNLINYEDILMFYYNNKDMMDNDYIHYKKSVLNCVEMINMYEYIKKNYDLKNNKYRTIRYDYNILLNKYYHCINNFKSMEFNIFSYSLINKAEKLNNILLYYISDIINVNNNDIKYNGFNTYKNYIYSNSPIEYNNSIFFDSL